MVRCHGRTWYVRLLTVENRTNKIYKAFYIDINGEPSSWTSALKSPAILDGSYSMSRKSHILNVSTLFLHFVLDGIASSSLPPIMMYTMMKEYFPEQRIEMIEVSFDLSESSQPHLDVVNGFLTQVL